MGSTGRKSIPNQGGAVTTAPPAPVPAPEPTPFDTAVRLDQMSRTDQLARIQSMQSAMGQTGNEAGERNPAGGNIRKLYVNTSKSYDINYFLATGKVGSPNSDWVTNMGYNKRMILNDIARLDRGMKPMAEDTFGYRYAGGGSLGRILGDSSINGRTIKSLIAAIKSNPDAAKNLGDALKGVDYTQPGYTSMSYVKEHSTFDGSDIRFDMVIRKGQPAIVTNNHPEHEVVSGRGLKYNFTGNVRVERVYSTALRGYKDQLVIEYYV